MTSLASNPTTTSWWTLPQVQQSVTAFAQVADIEYHYMRVKPEAAYADTYGALMQRELRMRERAR
jgi:hypothetical protein